MTRQRGRGAGSPWQQGRLAGATTGREGLRRHPVSLPVSPTRQSLCSSLVRQSPPRSVVGAVNHGRGALVLLSVQVFGGRPLRSSHSPRPLSAPTRLPSTTPPLYYRLNSLVGHKQGPVALPHRPPVPLLRRCLRGVPFLLHLALDSQLCLSTTTVFHATRVPRTVHGCTSSTVCQHRCVKLCRQRLETAINGRNTPLACVLRSCPPTTSVLFRLSTPTTSTVRQRRPLIPTATPPMPFYQRWCLIARVVGAARNYLECVKSGFFQHHCQQRR